MLLRPSYVTREQYDTVTAHISKEAMRCRIAFDDFLKQGNNMAYHERYAREFDALSPEFKHMSEDARNRHVGDLLKSDQYGFPASFIKKMTELVNELNFWQLREEEWECDEESRNRREKGKLPHWVVQIDDSAPGHERHDPRLARRTSIILN